MSYQTPLRILRLVESFSIIDGAGVSLAYVYFTEDPGRASAAGRLMPEDAENVAKIIARALTASAARSDGKHE